MEREKTPDMEAEVNEDDGTFINISLADDPGRPHEIRNVNISRRWLMQICRGSSLVVCV